MWWRPATGLRNSAQYTNDVLLVWQADWEEDSKGSNGLTFKMFHMSLFQIAGTMHMWAWCYDISELTPGDLVGCRHVVRQYQCH